MSQHVVIVDDDELTLKLFAEVASQIEGVVVHAFASSREAIDWYHGKQVDCFVFDYHMPEPNGLQMIRLVRALPEYALVPIVIATGAHEREIRYQALDAGANDFLQKPVDYREMLARLTTLLALHKAQSRLEMQIGELEQSLVEAEARSREHAERLEALWKIANNPNLKDDDLMFAMLQRGAAALRPPQPFRAIIGRVENGTDMRVLSVADAVGYEDRAPSDAVNVDRVVPLKDTIVGQTLAIGGTHTFNDIRKEDPNAPIRTTDFVRSREWHAMVVTSFSAGGSSYILAFASPLPAAKPFGPQDTAYVEVLASFFSAHFRQRWQSTRIGHQLEHDSLTGLLNRTRFRSLGRAAFDPNGSAIAVVDLVQLHALNETFGHLNGDAVMVEVAAALTAVAQSGEIVARVGGDQYGIFFPNAPSQEWLIDSVRRFGGVFSAKMGIGDREGKESLPVAARIGYARAPVDGSSVDELLLRAEGRARAASQSDRLIFPNS